MTRIVLLALLFCSRVPAQNVASGQPWDQLFRQSWIARSKGEFSRARELTVQGWALIAAAGPSVFGYADGVEQAYATTVNDGLLPASRFYEQALQATESPRFRFVRLEILIRKAFRYSSHQEVAANSAYQEALALIDSMPQPPGYFASMLRDFADLKRRMGDPDGAARLLARAASAPAYAPIPYPRFGMQDVPEKLLTCCDPGVKSLREESSRLLRAEQYESAAVVVAQMFDALEALPPLRLPGPTAILSLLLATTLTRAINRKPSQFCSGRSPLRRNSGAPIPPCLPERWRASPGGISSTCE